MTKNMKKSEQRGTLLVEALAMLGLIAMVTPTLYKKSADRLNEINDINVAAQARTMASVMDTFVRQNYSGLMSSAANESNSTLVIDFDDRQSGAYSVGYSSYLPYGYRSNELRGYDTPKVYVHRDNSTLVYYILYPKIVDPGNQRAARMASLVGANGGVITSSKEAKGTGGAWYLDSTMVDELDMDQSSLTENSLIVTSEEPITMSYDDSAKYLYRVPPANENDESWFHNTMVTDIYMGGHSENTDYTANANDYYSIYNVRRLTMNTNCNRDYISGAVSSTAGGFCDRDVADLYIGKPFAMYGHGTLNDAEYSKIEGNTGAAWIYGNLAALSQNFQLFRETDLYEGDFDDMDGGYDAEMNRLSTGYDVMQFARVNSTDVGDVEQIVFRAENKDGSSRVSFLDEFVQVRDWSSTVEFLVGSSSDIGGEGAFIHAFADGGINEVHINQNSTSSITEINRQGGAVYINGGSSHSTPMLTYINDMGGNFTAGYEGGWLIAQGDNGSSRVHLLANVGSSTTDNRIFTIGHTVSNTTGSISDPYDVDHIMYADKDRVSLRGGGIRVYSDNGYLGNETGTVALQPSDETISSEYATLRGSSSMTGLTTIASRYTDIFGPTYIGNKNMQSSDVDDGVYARNDYRLGVAGSAWIDELLWARQAWLKQAGMGELHAGFSNFKEFQNSSRTAWLNVYDDKVIIRNKPKASQDTEGEVNTGLNDAMLYADSQKIVLNDAYGTSGAWAWLESGSARIGTNENFFFADLSDGTSGQGSANVVGSTLVNLYTYNDDVSSVVDVQREAMRFGGHWTSSYANRIDAKTGVFTLKTKDVSSSDQDEGAQLYADGDMIRTRWVDFQVEDDSSTVRFRVAPNALPDSESDEANVQINGSFHVTGNEVIHIASNSSNAVGTTDNEHAMFEIDPEYVQIWSKDTSGNYVGNGGSSSSYYAMLRINPLDTLGGSSATSDTDDASIYIRKGAIELEESYSSGSEGFAADEGFGYIKANRFVSNAGEYVPSVPTTALSGYDSGEAYDQYMVNPAYTSVMHDIKLTTRGGARLSDILPDFVLKGVYNISNDFLEGSTTQRISWSCGSECSGGRYTGVAYDVAWANSYVGEIPYAMCPPGYRNMATIVPTSFNVGTAGDVIEADSFTSVKGSHAGKWYINPALRQGKILKAAMSNDGIMYPEMEIVSSMVYNGIYTGDNTFESFFETSVTARTEGWYLGVKPSYDDSAHTQTSATMSADTVDNISVYSYSPDGSSTFTMAQPLYFQSNNWLKASVVPTSSSWSGYLGFIYDMDYYSGFDSLGNTGIYSQNNQEGYNDASNMPTTLQGNYGWNVFPVPTNTLEGHATVYCYFNREDFNTTEWEGLVDQVDQLGNYRDYNQKGSGDYVDRLNDPSLKYKDPW